MKSYIKPVILAGGTGSRLWPLSRVQYPKQFLTLNSNNSMLQDTLLRLNSMKHEPATIICNQEHRFIVSEQLPSNLYSIDSIILEPEGRNTAPAICLAALEAMKNGDDPLLLILAADHVIKDNSAFITAIKDAVMYAEKDHLVTFGIVPTHPETGYGYIQRGEPLSQNPSHGYTIDSFVEKPNIELATLYFQSKKYYWNSGMFLFKASRYLEELSKHRPQIFSTCRAAFDGRNVDPDLNFIRVDNSKFRECPSESIDYAVMENVNDAIVIPLIADWNDVGSWSSLWDIAEKDIHGNVLIGDVIQEDTTNCYIHSPHRLVSTIDLHDLILIDTEDSLLVANRNQSQNIKKIVKKLENNNRKEYLHNRKIFRPWGSHEQIAEGSHYHVKKVLVYPGKKTAMQLHYHRSEHWIVVSGTAKVYRNDEIYIIGQNESIYIPVGVPHCFENPGKIPLEIIEVRTGTYLEEDDISRIEQSDNGY